MIEIKNLSYMYNKNDMILNDINLQIKDGEIISIIGKNGCGKSTLLKLIAGIIKPSSGNIFIDNIDISKKHNTDNNTYNYLTKEHIDNINKINKYVDKFIIVNSDNEQRDIFNADVYDTKAKIGTCKLKYDFSCRKFEDYNNI